MADRQGRRAGVLEHLADRIVAIRRGHPVRVAIDGLSAAGKSTLADELVEPVRRRGRPVIRVSIDEFKRPLDQRRLPRESPEGYYVETYDDPVIRRSLLDPLGPGGDRRYRSKVFDNPTQSPVETPERIAPADAILLADGGLLLRDELNDAWDYRIFVEIDFDLVLRRGAERDQAWMGSIEAARARYLNRYIPGERRYLRTVRPLARADAIVDNRDPANPRLRIVN